MPPAPPRTLDEAAEWLRKHFEPEAAGDLRVEIELDLTGPRGGPLTLRIDGGRLEVARSSAPQPQLRLRVAAPDYFAILAGRENAELLFMDGRLEIDGNLALAMKLRRLFPLRA